MRVEVHTVPRAVTLRCSGKIVLGVECEILRCMAETRNEPCLVLDLSRVHAMDAAGLGLLVELHCRAQRRNQALKIARPTRAVCVLMALTSLHSVLDVSGCEEVDLDDGRAASSGVAGRCLTA